MLIDTGKWCDWRKNFERRTRLESCVVEDVGVYDISSDGERFLMVRGYIEDAEGEDFTGFIIVQNWFKELRERMGSN